MKRIRRYHANSRTYLLTNSHVSGEKTGELALFDGMVREMFLEKLQDYAVFCGVDVHSFSILPDHFHLLIEVRRRETLSDEELLGRLGAIYHPLTVDEVREDLARARADDREGEAEEIRERYLRRMWDVSNFMKELLAWISQWVNKEKGRTGTLFEDRFRSVVVEKEASVMRLLAGYVEMAAVREGLVDRPEEWRWCSGGAASAGNRFAQGVVRRMLKGRGKSRESRERIEEAYCRWMERMTKQKAGEAMKRPEGREDLEGRMSVGEVLYCRVRYFTHGKAIGSQGFYGELRTKEGEKLGYGEWVKMKGGDFGMLYAATAIVHPVREVPV